MIERVPDIDTLILEPITHVEIVPGRLVSITVSVTDGVLGLEVRCN